MKAKKDDSRGAWRFAMVYAICLLILLLATIQFLLGALRQSSSTQVSIEPEEIYVYLPQESDSLQETEKPHEEEPEGYLVKEYQGQIGIFSLDGTLLETIETYVKTLPEADRALLGEGISVKTREELNSLIEDYSH